jgi:hypothetical protein
VVDRPRQEPPGGARKPARKVEASPAPEPDAREIVAYLRHHPDFLDAHPEALSLLYAPARDAGAGIVDFQHFLLERLRREGTRLAAEHKSLIATSRAALASQGRVHRAVLAILAAPGFQQLLQIVTTDLALLLDVDVVTIAVESLAVPAGRPPVHGIHLLKAGTIDRLLGEEREVRLSAGMRGEPALFGGAAGLVRAQALLRLNFGRAAPSGILCIGTRRAASFPPGLGTEMLSFLARALGNTIGQWLDPAR